LTPSVQKSSHLVRNPIDEGVTNGCYGDIEKLAFNLIIAVPKQIGNPALLILP